MCLCDESNPLLCCLHLIQESVSLWRESNHALSCLSDGFAGVFVLGAILAPDHCTLPLSSVHCKHESVEVVIENGEA